MKIPVGLLVEYGAKRNGNGAQALRMVRLAREVGLRMAKAGDKF
jgi:hypothetical protein